MSAPPDSPAATPAFDALQFDAAVLARLEERLSLLRAVAGAGGADKETAQCQRILAQYGQHLREAQKSPERAVAGMLATLQEPLPNAQ